MRAGARKRAHRARAGCCERRGDRRRRPAEAEASPTGEPVRHNLFYKRLFAPIAPGTRFHDLRHTCAAWLIEAGAHPLAVMQYLGHEDIRTTMNVYGHMFPAGLDALAASLDAGYRGSAATPIARVG